MSREAIQGALISITLILGLPLLRARDAEESARLMVYAGRQMQTLITEGVPRAGARPKSKRHIQLHILQGLPGVGPVRARRLLEKYGSISVALSATVDELAQLPGIGKGIADKIRWAVNEPPPGYLDGPVI
jgi:ERCC4-type nuclease